MLATAAMASAAAPAMADNGQLFDWNAQLQAFSTAGFSNSRQCFNGKFISGSNRSGPRTLYVQPGTGGVYKVQLGDNCDGLNAAEKLTLRSEGSNAVCDSHHAQVIVQTTNGAKRCYASEVRKLTSREVGDLAASAGR